LAFGTFLQKLEQSQQLEEFWLGRSSLKVLSKACLDSNAWNHLKGGFTGMEAFGGRLHK